jgi:predicted RNA-binding Zn ribbon-like protein
MGRVLGAVVRALQEDTWARLKACPDCQVVFYDHTRSRTKVWCGMLAGGPGGRACGTIAKVRRYRHKRRVQETAVAAAQRPER